MQGTPKKRRQTVALGELSIMGWGGGGGGGGGGVWLEYNPGFM